MAATKRKPGEHTAWRSITDRHLVLVLLLGAAFAVRLAVRFAFGQDYFWRNSYAIYYAMASNIVTNKSFCLPSGCAWLPPLYPLLLVPSVLAGKSFWLIVVPQALIGAGTTGCAYLIAREMFSRRAALLACAITAFYPYYVMHDTALQDTGTVTFCTALTIWLLLRARRLNRHRDWLAAGIALGIMPLGRASVALAIPVGLLWCAAEAASGGFSAKLRKIVVLALGAALTLGPWMFYTYRATGVPVITSQSGLALWMGNNPYTFSHYPAGSIDRSSAEARTHLADAERNELASRAHDEIATSNWYAHRALDYIRANPAAVAAGALRKIEAGFSWRLNPYREPLAETAYFLGYVPVAVLGLVGMVLAWQQAGTILVAMLFASFIAVTAVFWAHTSHRSYLDVYWIVFAASVADLIAAKIGLFARERSVAP